MSYNIYVVELDKAVARVRRFREENPDMDLSLPCLYVGQTSLSPEERFEQHKRGYKASRYVKKWGQWLRRRMYSRYNPIATQKEALAMERNLAKKLRAKGHGVWSK